MSSPDRLPSALELQEEAVALLRRTPAAAWLLYLGGACPFWLFVLWLWSSLELGRLTAGEGMLAAVAAVGLYLAMKTTQAGFCRWLLARRLDEPPAPLGFAGWRRVLSGQLRTQPWALLLFWGTVATIIPLPWALAYGQSLSVLGTDEAPARGAARQSRAVGRTEAVGTALLVLIFGVLYADLYVACLAGPWLAAHWLGLNNVFQMSGLAVINSTYGMMALILSWIAFDPLLKAIAVLRIFHARSRRSGEDLEVELRRLPGVVRGMAALATAAVVLAAPARAALTLSTQAGWPAALDRALRQPEYGWRRPARPEASTAAESAWSQRLDEAADFAHRQLDRAVDGIDSIWRWLTGRSPTELSDHAGGSSRAAATLHLLLVLAIVGTVVLLAAIVAQLRSARVSRLAANPRPAAEPEAPADPLDAARLPSHGWLKLARELAQQGEWRQASRAAYLATLAALADRGLIRLEKAKTNLDYERELRRRAPAQADLVGRFAGRRRQFEAVWYGRVPAEEEAVRLWIGELESEAGS